jgi:DNA-binding MarR family transcriptional regulator
VEVKQKCRVDEEIGNDHDLSCGEIRLLFAVEAAGPVSSAKLSSIAGISPSRGCRIIANLIKNGYLQKETNHRDKRYVTITLTAFGVTCLHSLKKQKESCEKKLEAKLNQQDIIMLNKALDTLLQIL